MKVSRAFAVGLQLALLFGIASRCLAGLGPENVAVVINEDSWASKAVANEFIALCHIPPANAVYIKDLPDFERTDVEFLRKRILAPVFETLDRRGLSAQIDCIAWSADLPYIVDITKDFASKPAAVVGNAASITGLTYLYQFLFAEPKNAPAGSYTLQGNNRYFRPPIAPTKGPAPTAPQQARLAEAVRMIRSARWTDAEATIVPLLQECPDYAEAHYSMALCSVHRGDLDAAVQSLRRAADLGWGDWRAWQRNRLLDPLRGRKDFQAALEKSRAVIEDVAPSLGFRSLSGWNDRGERVAPNLGVRYMLSVMLAVTSGRGNSVPQALGALRASAGANGSCPKGTFYFMRNEDIRSAVRDALFPSAIAKLRDMGLAAELDEGVLPRDKPDVMGAMIGAADFDWKASGSRILPGAICGNFTSFGGILTEGAGQTPLTSLIAFGAAASSGTVAEPLAIPEKFPSPFIQVHYARGCSLAEAYYQSVATPYQLLIVGDPLCAPWRRPPAVVVAGFEAGQKISGPFALKPSVAPGSPVAAQQFEIYMDGLRRGSIPPGDDAEGNAKEMLAGYHELRVVAVSGGAIEERDTTIIPFTVDKPGAQLAISRPDSDDVPWDRPLRLGAELKGAAEIRFLHNLRPVGIIHGEKGAAEIDPQLLGQGVCRIQCVALDADRKPIAASAFVEVRVVPPAPAPAVAPPAEPLSEKGLLLTPQGGAPIAVAETRKSDWLAAAAIKQGRPFALEGYFEAPEDGVCQFQVRGNVRQVVELDGRRLETPAADSIEWVTLRAADAPAWTFLPVSLAKGLHHLRVAGVAVKDPVLDIRFGGQGAQSIGPAFKHVKPKAPAPTSAPSAQPS